MSTKSYVVRHYQGSPHPTLKYPGGEADIAGDREDAEDLAAHCEELEHQLMQTQQMLLTIIYAQPEHKVTLTEANFLDLPGTPQTWQDNHEDGSFTLTVSSIRPATS